MSAAAAPAAAHRKPRTRAVHQQGLSTTLESFFKVSSSAAFVGCSRIGAHMLHQLLFLLGVALGVGRAESPCGWTSGSGSTFDLSGLKLMDGSYSPASFSSDPDVEIPEVCRSLMHTVGYKLYFIGERQVCSDLGFQQYGHWSLIDSNSPETGVRVEYGFGPQYSSQVRQSYDVYCDCSSGAGYPEVTSCPSLAVFPMPQVHSVCKMNWYSAYGCPYKCTGWQHTFLFVFILSAIGTDTEITHAARAVYMLTLAAVYLGGGLFYNVKRLGMPLEKESLPHYVFWTEFLPELVREGITYTILTAKGLSAVPLRGRYDQL